MPPYSVNFSRKAEKTLTRLASGNPDAARRIAKAVRAYAEDGRGDVKKLEGRPDFRLRVGDYRIMFELEENVMIVLSVSHRSSAY